MAGIPPTNLLLNWLGDTAILFVGMSDSDEDVVNLQVEDDEDQIELILDPDSLYQNECGYWIITMFRGQSTGRKLKKDVAKISIAQFICSVAFMVLAQEPSM